MPVDCSHQTELLDHRNEAGGRHQGPVSGAHAQQAFVVTDLVRLGIDHRLIGQRQTVFTQRRLDLLTDGHGRAVTLLLGGAHLEDLYAILALGLGLEHGAFCLGHDIKAGLRLLGKEDDADRGGKRQLIARGQDWRLPQGRQDAFGRCPRPFQVAVAENGAKAVTAGAADDIGRA